MDVLYGALILWFVLTLGSLIFVLWDQLTNTPSLRVMTLAWALIILYTGPFGLFIYFLSCRQPLPNTHDQFIDVHWKQTVGSLIHCVAGDATAIIIMAAILHFFALPNGIELIIEYIAAYFFGLFIFQALFMRSMFSSYSESVRKTIFAETVSMNFVMAGMFPAMIILEHFLPISSNPFTIYFWGRMAVATIVGAFFTYPINSWMVRKHVKHGMMSKSPMPNHEMSSHAMQFHSLSITQQIIVVISTYLFLFAMLWITGQFVPIYF